MNPIVFFGIHIQRGTSEQIHVASEERSECRKPEEIKKFGSKNWLKKLLLITGSLRTEIPEVRRLPASAEFIFETPDFKAHVQQ